VVIPATRLYIPSFIAIRSGVSEPRGVKFGLSHYFGLSLLQQLVLPYKPWLARVFSACCEWQCWWMVAVLCCQTAVVFRRPQVEKCWNRPTAGNCFGLTVSALKSQSMSKVCLLPAAECSMTYVLKLLLGPRLWFTRHHETNVKWLN